MFRITSVAPGDHITGRITPGFARLYGELAVTYQVRPAAFGTGRVVVALAAADRAPARLRRRVLSLGDRIMMRRQLLNLKELAEGTSNAP